MQIVIPFAQVKAINPNLPNRNPASTLESYLKCIAVSCHSFRSHNSAIRIILITNSEIVGETKSILSALNVEVVNVPFTFVPSAEFGHKFKGCFYFFDALRSLNEDSLIIDPDVICLGNLTNLVRSLGRNIAVFRPNFHPEKLINGISPLDAVEIYRTYRRGYTNLHPDHVGGEAIYFPKECISNFIAEVSQFWEWNLSQAKKGSRFLTTEEHIITCILGENDCDNLNEYVSRIWTTRSYREVEGHEKDPDQLILWHLPSEKHKGFKRIYDEQIKSNLNLQNLQLTKQYYANVMNVYPNYLSRIIYRTIRKFKA